MWLLPSRRRPHYLQNFFAACSKVGISTPGRILVDHEDYKDLRADYDKVTLPPGWQFQPTKKVRMGDKIQEVWDAVVSQEWLGILNDDHLPQTPNWDLRLVQSLNGWNLVSSRDGGVHIPHPAGASCYSGDLMRTLGWMFPPGVYHCFVDTIWALLGRSTCCWQIRGDVMVEHFHAIKSGINDETHRMGRDNYGAQEREYLNWLQKDKDLCVEKIRELREGYFQNSQVPKSWIQYSRAMDLFFDNHASHALVEFERFLHLPEAQDATMRSIARIYMAQAHASLRSSDSQVVECLFKAVGEAPMAAFPWAHLANVMAMLQDWPNCFTATVNALRGPQSITDLVFPEPPLEANLLELLEKSTRNLGLSKSAIDNLRATRGFAEVNVR